MICFKFYRQSCARIELKTVKDNPPSQHLTGNPLAFDRRLCPGARLGNLNLCLAGVGNLNRSAKRRFSRRVESHGRRFYLLRKSWVGNFNNFFLCGGGGGGNGEIWTDQPSKVRMPKGLSRGGCWRWTTQNGRTIEICLSLYTPQGPARSRSEGILYKDIKNL